MDVLHYLCQACSLGFALAMPFGPLTVFCISETLSLGLLGGLAVSLGVTSSYGIYGLITGLGISAISAIIMSKINTIKIVAGIFLLWLAYKETEESDAMQLDVYAKTGRATSKKLIRLVTKAFILSAINPLTFLSLVGIVSALKPESVLHAILASVGIFVGSLTWYCVLIRFTVAVKRYLSIARLSQARWLMALVLGAFGLSLIVGGALASNTSPQIHYADISVPAAPKIEL